MVNTNYLAQQVQNAATGDNTELRPSDLINQMWQKSVDAQRAINTANRDIALSGYNTQLAGVPETYQTVRNSAALDRAMQERVNRENMANMGMSGAGGTSRTLNQRNNLNYLNNIGSANLQQQNTVDNINSAINNLNTQYAADDASLLATSEAGRLSDLLTNYQWQNEYDANQAAQTFQQAQWALANGYITADQFNQMTGMTITKPKSSRWTMPNTTGFYPPANTPTIPSNIIAYGNGGVSSTIGDSSSNRSGDYSRARTLDDIVNGR